jgi:hypothetical protein
VEGAAAAAEGIAGMVKARVGTRLAGDTAGVDTAEDCIAVADIVGTVGIPALGLGTVDLGERQPGRRISRQ